MAKSKSSVFERGNFKGLRRHLTFDASTEKKKIKDQNPQTYELAFLQNRDFLSDKICAQGKGSREPALNEGQFYVGCVEGRGKSPTAPSLSCFATAGAPGKAAGLRPCSCCHFLQPRLSSGTARGTPLPPPGMPALPVHPGSAVTKAASPSSHPPSSTPSPTLGSM